MIPVVLGMARQFELMGIHDDPSETALNQLEAQGWDLARKCLHFELQFKSTETMSTVDGKYNVTAEATVPIELSADILSGLTGSADLIPSDFSTKVQNCSFQTTLGNGTFKVVSLVFIDAPPDSAHPYGYVKAIHLTYSPGSDTEVTTETCPRVPPVTYPPMHLWSIGYQAMHIMDMAGGDQGVGNSLPNIGSLLGGLGISNLPSVPGMPQLPAERDRPRAAPTRAHRITVQRSWPRSGR